MKFPIIEFFFQYFVIQVAVMSGSYDYVGPDGYKYKAGSLLFYVMLKWSFVKGLQLFGI